MHEHKVWRPEKRNKRIARKAAGDGVEHQIQGRGRGLDRERQRVAGLVRNAGRWKHFGRQV